MKRSLFLLSMLFVASGQIGAQYDHLLFKTHGQRYRELNQLVNVFTMFDDSAKAFVHFNAIAARAEKEGDEDLAFEIELMRVAYFGYRDQISQYSPEKIVSTLEALAQKAEKEGRVWAQGSAELHLANWYLKKGELEKAFEHLDRMYALVKDFSHEEFPSKSKILIEFANQIYAFKEYRAAMFYLSDVLRDSIWDPWDYNFIQRLNTMGLCYRGLGMLDSSDYFFKLTLREAMERKNLAWEGISSGNLGENYFLRGEYDVAIPFLQKDADIGIKCNDPGLVSNALTILGEIGLKRGQLPLARRELYQARENAFKSKQLSRLGRLYPVLARYHLLAGEKEKALLFQDSSFVLRDSLERAYSSMMLKRAYEKVELEKHSKELQKAENEKRIGQLQRNALILIVALIILLAVFVFDHYRRKDREKSMKLEMAEAELTRAEEELKRFTDSISNKNKLIEDLSSRLGTPDTEILEQLQQSTILTDAQWQEFRELFSKVHKGFLQRLQQKHRGLSPAETRLMVLIRLRLSTREMASMLGVGMDTVRQHRSRLRKKLNLTEQDNLEALAETL